jgi:hypothetical protein
MGSALPPRTWDSFESGVRRCEPVEPVAKPMVAQRGEKEGDEDVGRGRPRPGGGTGGAGRKVLAWSGERGTLWSCVRAGGVADRCG